MNDVKISGTVAGNSELRKLDNGRELLNFDVCVDGPKGRDPIIHIAFFPRRGDVRRLESGRRVSVEGSLRHRFDSRLFVAARMVQLLGGPLCADDGGATAGKTSQPSQTGWSRNE
jgi:hypothetical protein